MLIGVKAEEGGAGKVILLQKGAYEGMDVCLMYVLENYPSTTIFTLYILGVILLLVLLVQSA